MNQETKLRLQAYFDNELSDRESKEIAALLERDSEAKALCEELGEIQTALRNYEPEIKLPESREFYWSKIERSIHASGEPVKPSLPGRPWWVRFFAPALGAALVLTAAVSIMKFSQAPSKLSYLHEIETPREDTSTMSFHSASAGMTVVWVQSRVY